ncbi:MAG: WecB/TagA/CpsF family glycosyltransferase [Deltaproteobacteria bacterium]|nr:WecB/TagA/CpsF family glycosyltransferase [Deltaproteobacteria bacterium]
MIPARRVDVLGLPIHALTRAAFLGLLDESLAAGSGRTFIGVNAHSLRLALDDSLYFRILQEADILYAEGASIVFASCLLGGILPAKLTTTDLWPLCCELAVERGYAMFLLGGEPGLAQEAAAATRRRWPGIRIAGTFHGYFHGEDEEVVRAVNQARPDLLWVGMGEPRQAIWAQSHKKMLHVGAILTCGGMFRLIAGTQRRPASLLHATGFEWLGRIMQEPAVWRRYARDFPFLGFRLFRELLFRGWSR